MQAVLEKIFDDNSKSHEAKKSLLQTILNNIKNNESKVAFLKSGITYLLSMENTFETLFLRQYLLSHIQEIQTDCYSLDEIKNIMETNDDLFTLVSFTDLVLKVTKDRTKTLQIRSVFLKTIKKDENFWLTNFIRDFFAQKLKKPTNPAPNNNPPQISLPDFEYNKYFLQVRTAFAFFSENPSFYPPNFDSKDVLLKWFLTTKNKTDAEKAFQEKAIEELLNICRTNYQVYIICFKMFIKALTITYANDEVFECHYSIYNFLKQTDPRVIEDLMKPLMVGEPAYNNQDWLKVFKNFVRVGLTENIGIAFLALAKGFENIKAFEVLLRIQEEVVPFAIFPLKVEEWQKSALDILSYFILQGPINANLLSKILKKLFTVASQVCKENDTQFGSDLVSFLGHLKSKYSQSSFVEEIETEYNNFLKECQINPIQINLQRYSISPWTSLQVQSPGGSGARSKYRGLVNLGNTCYMNSFVQSLFMTKLFRYRILTLGDIVQKLYSVSESLKDPTETAQGNNTKSTALDEKKKAVSLFQLQKLFAYLVSSEREAITPNFLKATLPLHFKTSHAQEDSSEFGRFYLDDLEKSLAQTEERDLIKELFTGEIISHITCQDCQTKYKKTENFIDLSLNFESRDASVSYDLDKLVHKNFEPIEFKDNNQYFCENCQKLSSCAIKTHVPTKLPPILILTINRFYFDTTTFQRVKVLSHVNVTEELDLIQENELGLQEEVKYDLYAIIVHRGMTLDYGHYYTAAKENVNDPTWILFDDSTTMSLEKLDPFEYVKNNKQDAPYILFYQARDYFNKSMNNFSDFKLTTGLRRIVEQDNVSYLKEIDQNAKLMASITALSVPQHLMTGPSVYKKDEGDDDDVSKPNGFNNSNRFIM